MDVTVEKKNILQWIKGLTDEKIIEKILDLKGKNELSSIQNQLILKGLKDIEKGNIAEDAEVQLRFQERFSKK